MIRDFQNTISISGSNPKPSPEVKYGPGIAGGNTVVDDEDYPVIRIFDPEQFQKENPCEDQTSTAGSKRAQYAARYGYGSLTRSCETS